MTLEASPRTRAAAHAALADEGRLRIVDLLTVSDRAPGELVDLTGMSSNLIAFHLGVLEAAGIVARHRSEGDARRRYVRIRWEALDALTLPTRPTPSGGVLFVCTRNSARSQFAEARWRQLVGGAVASAGTEPAERVHRSAVAAARSFGVDLSGHHPKGYADVPGRFELVVSVCDRALEAGLPTGGRHVHWSVPDPVDADPRSFRTAFTDIASRIDRLRGAVTEAA